MEQAIRVTLLLYFGSLCCFVGYRLRQALVTAAGILGGAALGFILARLLQLPDFWWGIAMAAAFALILGLSAFRLHKLGLFLLCGACAMLLSYHYLSLYAIPWLDSWMLWAAAAVVGVVAGLLVYKFHRPAVIVITALFGGMLLADTVFQLLSPSAAVQYFGHGVGLATSLSGAWVQFHGKR